MIFHGILNNTQIKSNFKHNQSISLLQSCFFIFNFFINFIMLIVKIIKINGYHVIPTLFRENTRALLP
jgi:hypothetical protein